MSHIGLGSKMAWDFTPLHSVGPLRFGMSERDVIAALNIKSASFVDGNNGHRWQEFWDHGITALHRQEYGLVGVLVSDGPQVTLEGIELIGRRPSSVKKGLNYLLTQKRLEVKSNWSNDPEIPELGLSMGGGRDGDSVVSEALFVARELSQDPYRTATVAAWRDVYHEEHVFLIDEKRLTEERPCWDLRPWVGVGPLHFGMRAQEVRAALGADVPTATNLAIDHGCRFGRQVEWEWYESVGVTVHYDGPFLLAVNVDGRIGPQVTFKGVQLVGATPSVVEHEVLHYAELKKLGVSAGTTGLTNVYELGLALDVVRLGDCYVSSPTFATRQWMDGAR
ncbi:hypothetical protein GCM10023100_01020 [Actinocorallia cavernae]|uniref:Uncharacterized protein n=1 Tax=Actinocorallia cavernae TaxID=328075 RepID=A0ABP8S5W1_9ACTN